MRANEPWEGTTSLTELAMAQAAAGLNDAVGATMDEALAATTIREPDIDMSST